MNMQTKLSAVSSFAGMKVAVIGDTMLDIYDFCSTADSKEIPSEMPGKRAYRAHKSIQVLGGAGNVAANLASLGVDTELIGMVGNDGYAVTLRGVADAQGIRHRLIVDPSRPTTLKMRVYIDDEYVLRRDDEADDDASALISSAACQEVEEIVDACDALILSDYDKGFLTPTAARGIIETASTRHVPVIVDFKPSNRARFQGATIIAPNQLEAVELAGDFPLDDRLQERTLALHATLACANTVVTLGARGVCGTDGSTFFHVDGSGVPVVDTVGCGDTVRAVLALAHARGLALDVAAELANDAASVIVQKRATALMTSEELTAYIAQAQG